MLLCGTVLAPEIMNAIVAEILKLCYRPADYFIRQNIPIELF
jgi:hypothetical protein